jgi:hypothetical protein
MTDSGMTDSGMTDAGTTDTGMIDTGENLDRGTAIPFDTSDIIPGDQSPDLFNSDVELLLDGPGDVDNQDSFFDTSEFVEVLEEQMDVGGELCIPGTVMINELVASNVNGLQDEDSERPDWVELINTGELPVDLTGWGLSDNEEEPFKWFFPTYVLNPGATMVVFASSKDRVRPQVTWDTIIDAGATWSYSSVIDGVLPESWEATDFDDEDWRFAPSGFGSYDNDDETSLFWSQIILRKNFTLTPEVFSILDEIIFHVDYDDAFIAYLNGVEIVRENLDSSVVVPTSDDIILITNEALLYQGLPIGDFPIESSTELVVEGENLIAIRGLDGMGSFPDLTLLPLLTLSLEGIRDDVNESDLISPPLSHTNFAISSDGEPIVLTDSQGCTVDVVEPVSLCADCGYARVPGGGDWDSC